MKITMDLGLTSQSIINSSLFNFFFFFFSWQILEPCTTKQFYLQSCSLTVLEVRLVEVTFVWSSCLAFNPSSFMKHVRKPSICFQEICLKFYLLLQELIENLWPRPPLLLLLLPLPIQRLVLHLGFNLVFVIRVSMETHPYLRFNAPCIYRMWRMEANRGTKYPVGKKRISMWMHRRFPSTRRRRPRAIRTL